jgi:hypothetical protein
MDDVWDGSRRFEFVIREEEMETWMETWMGFASDFLSRHSRLPGL